MMGGNRNFEFSWKDCHCKYICLLIELTKTNKQTPTSDIIFIISPTTGKKTKKKMEGGEETTRINTTKDRAR